MKKLVLALALFAVTFGVATQASHADDQPAYRFRAAGGAVTSTPATMDSALAPPPFDGPKVDNVATVNYGHFGNVANGLAVIQAGIYSEQSDLGLPIFAQGQCRANRTYRVLRIALRCELFTLKDGVVNDHAIGPLVNNANQSSNPRTFLALTPQILTGGLSTDPNFCDAYSIARYSIRWDDQTLTSGKVLIPPATWRQANCDHIPSSAAP